MLALFGILTGCVREQLEIAAEAPEGAVAISLDGSIVQEVTKVNAGGFETGDGLGLYAVNYTDNNRTPGTLLVEGNQADHVKYVFDEGAWKWTPVRGVYYKDVNTNVDLYVFYPHAEPDAIEDWNFEVKKDQSSAKTSTVLGGYEASDFLWAKAENIAPTEAKIKVKLEHKMACAEVVLEQGDGFEAGDFQRIEKTVLATGTTRKASINLATGSVTPIGSAQATGIVTSLQTDGSFRAIVVPQAVSAGTPLFSITIDGVAYKFSKDAGFTYESGKVSRFTIKVDRKSPTGEYELSLADFQIVPWTEDRNTYEGEARQYYCVHCEEPGTLGRLIKADKKNPDKIRNLKVSGKITTEDFYFMRDSMAILEAVNLKESKVINVKDHQEYNGSYWEYITIDDVIPNDALRGKNTLLYFSFPEVISRIGDYAFMETNLSGVLIIPDDVTEIGSGAFCWTLISTVTFPDSLLVVHDYAFSSCKSLTGKLILPESIVSIGASAFANCSFIGELHLPNSLENIGDYAFSNAGSFIGDLSIPDKVTKLKGGTFRGSGFSGTLDLNNVVELGPGAFEFCGFGGGLIIPDGIATIPVKCFYKNAGRRGGFREIKLPETLKNVDESSFQGQSRLESVEFKDGLINIGERSFYSCSHLMRIELPSTIQTIQSGAFSGCCDISEIICNAIEPPSVLSAAFDGVAKDNFTVEVPAQSVIRYKTESGWSDFRRIAAHYDFSPSRDRIRTLNAKESRTLILRAPANFSWSIDSKPDWVTVSPASGTGKADITISVDEMARTNDTFEINEGSFNSPSYRNYKGRSDEVVFKLDEKDYTCKVDVEQYDSDYSDGEVMTLNKATKGAGIDIVFIGDGYDAKDIAKGTFKINAEDGCNHFFGLEPFSTYRDYFNVYAVVSKSDDSGIGTVNTVIDTKFGSYFTQNRIKTPSPDACFAWAKKADSNIDFSKSLVIMLMNTSTYEGITMMYGDGSAIACCPVSTDAYPYDFRGIIQHEAGGHGFGKLGDEYIYHNAFIQTCICTDGCEHPKGDNDLSSAYGNYKSRGWYRNLSMTADAKQVPWAHLIYHKNYSDKVDMYEGGYMHTRGVYRSEATSCMNNNIPYYSAISRQAIVERIKEYAGEAFDFDDFVAKDSFNVGTKAVSRSFDWTFGVDPKFVRTKGEMPVYMGEHPNVK